MRLGGGGGGIAAQRGFPSSRKLLERGSIYGNELLGGNEPYLKQGLHPEPCIHVLATREGGSTAVSMKLAAKRMQQSKGQ